MPPNVSVSALVKFPGVVGLRGRRGLVWCPLETIICVFAFIVAQEPNECSVFVVCWHQNIPKHSTNREQNYTTPNLTTDLFINVPVLFVVLTRMGSSQTLPCFEGSFWVIQAWSGLHRVFLPSHTFSVCPPVSSNKPLPTAHKQQQYWWHIVSPCEEFTCYNEMKSL